MVLGSRLGMMLVCASTMAGETGCWGRSPAESMVLRPGLKRVLRFRELVIPGNKGSRHRESRKNGLRG